MNETDLLIMNFEEIRRRSIKIWTTIPQEMLDWRPDPDAFSCREMIHHVLEGEFFYHQIVENRGSVSLGDIQNPYETKEFVTVEEALDFATPYREQFITYIKTLNEDDLSEVPIDRSDVGYIRSLGDMLLRIAYHEAVHTGQLLDYLRTAGVERADIWD